LNLYDVFEETIQRATNGLGAGDPFRCFLAVHDKLRGDDDIFLNGAADVKQLPSDEVFRSLRGVQRIASNADVCRKSMCYMIAAKLHSELKAVVCRGNFVSVFDEKLKEVMEIYEITELSAASLKRYLAAGRLMLQCRSLAFVNVSLLIDQQKMVEEMLNDDEIGPKLTELVTPKKAKALDNSEFDVSGIVAGFDFSRLNSEGAGGDKAPREWTTVHSLNQLMDFLCNAVKSLDKLTPTAHLTVADFAKILRMDFGNQLSHEDAQSQFSAGHVDMGIALAYKNFVNRFLAESGAKGRCFLDTDERIVVEMDWIAVAFCSLNVGVLVNGSSVRVYDFNLEGRRDVLERKLVTHLMGVGVLRNDAAWSFVNVEGYSETKSDYFGMLHFLSQIIWRNSNDLRDEVEFLCPVREVLQLQLALELYREQLLAPHESLLDVIARESRHILPLRYEVPTSVARVELNRIMQSGFLVVRQFVEVNAQSALDLIRVVKESDLQVDIFQSAGGNDKRRKQVEIADMYNRLKKFPAGKALVDSIQKILKESVEARKARNMVALLSLAGCGAQRPHTDYTEGDLDDLMDDGVCGGLPLGVIIALQDRTFFDAWPGARKWRHDRFYEHVQLELNAGDAIFFLPDAVHAGAAFAEENCRIHAYLESSLQHNNRAKDRTRFVDVASGVATILPRGVKIPP